MSIIAKYKFDKSIYENLIPVFNDGYTGYTISDEIDNGNNNHIIRTIECDTLPTLIRFGYTDNTPTNTITAASSLLEVLQLNISNIVNLGYVFCNCNCLTTVNSSDWDTSNVTNMAYMFNGCQSLTSLDVSNWNNNEVTRMEYMFFQCQKLSSLNMKNWNASKVNDIQFMFKFCNSLTELDLSNWNITNQLSNAYQSLCACQKLKHLNISNWDLSNAHAASMFDINNNLDNIIMKNSNYNSVNKVITALPTRTTESKGTLNITGIDDISQVNTSTANSKCWDIVQEEVENSRVVARYKFDKSIYENLIPVFNDGYTGYTISDEIDSENSNHVIRTIECDTLPTIIRFGHPTETNASQQSLIGLDYLNTSNLTSLYCLVGPCINIEYVNCSDWDTSNVTNMSGMFSRCYNLTSLDVSNWDTSNVTNMNYMFNYCQALTSLDVSNFDTSNVKDMTNMFYKCTSLTSLDVSNWDTGNVKIMKCMFEDCNNLTSLNVSKWDTSNVISMQNMFIRCRSLTSLDVSNWDTSKVTDMQFLFENCQSLSSLDVSNWNTSNVTNMRAVFQACNNLTSLDVSNWDTSKVTNFNSMIRYINKLRTVNINNLVMNSSNEPIEKLLRGDTALDKIYVNDKFVLNHIMENIPDRTSAETPGCIITTIIDQIDEETIELLSSKNWQIKDLVAQYRFDANTYEDLMPEFNPEFTEDMYEVHDSVSEIVIDNIEWEPGAIDGGHGGNTSHIPGGIDATLTCIRFANFISVIPNVEYKCVDSYNEEGILFDWYDENKVFIKQEKASSCIAPLNAKYMRAWTGRDNIVVYLSAKLVTRTIESKNGELPTLMRFGHPTSSTIGEATPKELCLLKIHELNSNNLTSMKFMFRMCARLLEIDCSNWDVSKVTNMQDAFQNCRILKEINVSDWNTSNVTVFTGVFNTCSAVSEIDVSKWDTSKGTVMHYMFQGCNITSLDVSNWDTSNVTNMYAMFHGCNKLTSLDVSKWDTGNVTAMGYMFANCRNLTSLDVSNFNTSNVTDMNSMFQNCYVLTSLDVSNWDTSNVIYMDSLFHNCKKLTSIDVSKWNVDNVIRMDNLFNSCNELVSIDVSNWNTSNVQNMGCLFGWCFKLQSVDLSNWDTSKVVYMNYMFIECYELTSIGDTSNWDTGNVTDMGWMFANCNNLTSLDVSNFNTSNVTNMFDMFSNCSLLSSLDVSNWNTSNVTNMHGMFYGCQSLTSLDVLEWDTSSLRDITSLFYDCSNLKSLDVSHWNVDKCGHTTDDDNIYSMRNVFNNTGLRVLNLSKWSKIEWLYDILEDGRIVNNFIKSAVLKTIDFGNCKIPNYPVTWLNAPNLRYIKCDNGTSVVNLIEQVPARTEAEQGYLITKAEVSDEIRGVLSAKYWNVVKLEEVGTDIAIYKFDKSVYKSMVPVFNNEFVDWFIDDVVEDEVNAPNIVTRTIRSMGGLPTQMRFGCSGDLIGDWEKVVNDQRTNSLLSVTYINNSDISTMLCMFYGCCYLKNANITVTEKVNNMKGMYYLCHRIESIDTANWDTSNVTDMTNLFCECHNLTSLDVSDFDTSKVTNIHYMFFNCQSLTSLDVSGFDTRNVGNMSYMFYGCKKLNALDVSNFDTSNVVYMHCMFYECKLLTSLDVSNFDTSKVTNMNNMFYDCNNLTSLDVSNFDTSNVTTMQEMFYKCISLTSLDLSNFNTRNVTNIAFMFKGCQSLTSLDVSNWDTSNVTIIHQAFSSCQSLTSLDVSNWDTSRVNDMAGIFWDCYSLTEIDLSNWDTTLLYTVNENALNHAFCSCRSLTSLDLSNFITKGVTKMNAMLDDCWNLVTLDISNFDMNDVNDVIPGQGFIRGTEIENIGMIYCDFKTVEKVASVIPTTNSTSIWVGNHIDINGLPQYDHITYKVYEVEDKLEVELSSPLLEGDRLEIIDGNLYHYHKMNMFTVDKNDHDRWVKWTTNSTDQIELDEIGHSFYINNKVANELGAIQYSDGYCSAMIFDGRESNIQYHTQLFDHVRMSGWLPADGTPNHRLYCFTGEKYDNINDFKQYIQKLYPFNVTYILNNPYYELVKPNVGLLNAEQGLYLNISDSVVPVVNHQDLCTLKLNYLLPNVQYKVKFKADNPGSIAINLGGTLVPLDVVEGWNEIMVTTPETLVDEYLKVNGPEDIKIQNVMVIDSNKDFDYFKGMNNTFDEIPVKNICKNRTLTYTHGVDEEGVSPQGEMNVNVGKGKVVTVVGKVSNNPNNLPISINLYNDTGRATGKNLFDIEKSTTANFTAHHNIDENGYIITDNAFDKRPWDYANSDFKFTLDAGTYTLTMLNHILGTSIYNGIAIFDNNNTCIIRNIGEIANKHKNLFTSFHLDKATNLGLMIKTMDNSIQIQIEEGTVYTEYEPFRNCVNDEPVYIDYTTAVLDGGLVDLSTTDGEYFVTTIRADRDYVNRIGFNVGDASSCEANDQVTITDLMVFEGDILDCHPTTYVDPADTRYLVEYKSIGNPFGFGKNKLI